MRWRSVLAVSISSCVLATAVAAAPDQREIKASFETLSRSLDRLDESVRLDGAWNAGTYSIVDDVNAANLRRADDIHGSGTFALICNRGDLRIEMLAPIASARFRQDFSEKLVYFADGRKSMMIENDGLRVSTSTEVNARTPFDPGFDPPVPYYLRQYVFGSAWPEFVAPRGETIWDSIVQNPDDSVTVTMHRAAGVKGPIKTRTLTLRKLDASTWAPEYIEEKTSHVRTMAYTLRWSQAKLGNASVFLPVYYQVISYPTTEFVNKKPAPPDLINQCREYWLNIPASGVLGTSSADQVKPGTALSDANPAKQFGAQAWETAPPDDRSFRFSALVSRPWLMLLILSTTLVMLAIAFRTKLEGLSWRGHRS